jgi:myo-inositol 2-dehydrogenase/D-chiro-inositol 1-dehydrogenase
MVGLGILGIGRIGRIHLQHVARHFDDAAVVAAMNPSEPGRDFARRLGVPFVTGDAAAVIGHPDVDAVLVCTSTHVHADLVEAAAAAGKAVFCEKPIDLSLPRVRQTLASVAAAGVPLMLAFNQRMDPSFAAVKSAIDEGRIGSLRSIHIISRDPAPPPIAYIRTSGGLFLDMGIHDFDMARHLAGAEAVEVYAKGAVLVDPAIGEAGDIDTAYVTIGFANGVTAMIENSRQSAYGYDQRLEAFGSAGMVRADNPLKTTALLSDATGLHGGRQLDFFVDRYAESYLREMRAFVDALQRGGPMPITGHDGLEAMRIALAAERSHREGRPVKVAEVDGGH